jgi:hypothetical protein
MTVAPDYGLPVTDALSIFFTAMGQPRIEITCMAEDQPERERVRLRETIPELIRVLDKVAGLLDEVLWGAEGSRFRSQQIGAIRHRDERIRGAVDLLREYGFDDDSEAGACGQSLYGLRGDVCVMRSKLQEMLTRNGIIPKLEETAQWILKEP